MKAEVMRQVRLLLCGLALLTSPAGAVQAQDLAVLDRAVLPLLKARCGECHGPVKPKGKLNLSSTTGIARGGKSGPVIVPGNLDDSLMWLRIDDDEMPPDPSLPDKEKDMIRRWIERGAKGLSEPGDPAADGEEGHRAFQPLRRPPVPAADGGRSAVDRFVLARLASKGLSLGPPASRAAFIRRVSFDLTGLPPTPAEIAVFLDDPVADAYERLVERYLASPRYGERWGTYWLDVAGYADSNGYFSADTNRPLAYRYRDYVIRAFNEDKPYDRFVREQLAGDELAGYRTDGDVTGEMVGMLEATQFLRNSQDGTGESDGNPDEVRTDRLTVLEGTLQITMNSLLGITIQCARCHEHKFEPVSQEEYYSLQAIFLPAYNPDRWVKPNDRVVAVGTRREREAHARKTEAVEGQITTRREKLAMTARPFRRKVIEERLKDLDPSQRGLVLQAWETLAQERTDRQKELLEAHEKALAVDDDELAKRFTDLTPVLDEGRRAIERLEKARPAPLSKIAAMVDVDLQPPAHRLLLQGRHNAPGPEVRPGVPAALSTKDNVYRVRPINEGGSTGRRLAFARWMTSRENPLFARVMANRIWQRHFRVGLIATPDNLGQSGAVPSHPRLLDYLAAELVRGGWSIKAMHRMILNSAVYRQSSAPRDDALASDPDNRLLWRYPLRRLDAEALRDTMLRTSGELDCRMYGPYVPTRRMDSGKVIVDESIQGTRRRSVYLQARRTQVVSLLELFDAPSMVSNCPQRSTSTIPLQSLALLNSEFALARAGAFARRLASETGPTDSERLRYAFLLAAGRAPDPAERRASERFLSDQRNVYGQEKDSEWRLWSDFCQMLLASNALLYVQ